MKKSGEIDIVTWSYQHGALRLPALASELQNGGYLVIAISGCMNAETCGGSRHVVFDIEKEAPKDDARGISR